MIGDGVEDETDPTAASDLGLRIQHLSALHCRAPLLKERLVAAKAKLAMRLSFYGGFRGSYESLSPIVVFKPLGWRTK